VVPYLVSNVASPSIGSVVAGGFVELSTQDLVSQFHATSSPFLMLQHGLKASIVTALSSSVTGKSSVYAELLVPVRVVATLETNKVKLLSYSFMTNR